MTALSLSPLDLVLVVVLLAETVLGWRRGLLATALGTVGLVLGALGGIAAIGHLSLEPLLWSRTPLLVILLPLVVIALLAAVGQRLGIWVGLALARSGQRPRGPAQRQRAAPRLPHPGRLLGAVLAFAMTSVLIWLIVPALRGVGYGPLTQQLNASAVVHRIDAGMPGAVRREAEPLRTWLDDLALHRVLNDQVVTPPTRPGQGIRGAEAIAKAGPSVVKVRTVSEICRRGREGTGWVVAGDRVVTNAHVLAGASRVAVQTANGDGWLGTVVAFDAGQDVAVLLVPGIAAPALPVGPQLSRGADAAVAGYPLDGPYVVRAARVRSLRATAGPDIYGQGQVVRDVYSLATTVQQGNSGGPLLDTRGRAVGMVYARSADDPRVGYAMDISEVTPVLRSTDGRTTPVDTGHCVDVG